MIKVKTTSSFYLVGLGVFDVNSIIELKDDLAQIIVKQGLAECIEEQIEEEEVQTEQKKVIDYSKLKVTELKELLNDKGIEIPKGAKKADLISLLSE